MTVAHRGMAHPTIRNLSAPIRRHDIGIRWTVGVVGVLIYLWVTHSAKAPIATLGIVVALIGVFSESRQFRFPAPLAWFGLLLLWALVASTASLAPGTTQDALLDFGKLWLILFIIVNVAQDSGTWRAVSVGWLAIFALYPLRGIFFNIVFGQGEQGRYAWNFIFRNPNDFAALTLPVLAMTIAMLQGPARQWIRVASMTGVILLPLAILATQSRGGILALGTLVILVAVPHLKKFRAVALTLMAAGVAATFAPEGVWDRLAGLKGLEVGAEDQSEVDSSADQRYEIWRVARGIIADHPVMGIGLGAYPEVHARYASTGPYRPTARGARDTHSIYLNVLAETGVPGLVFFSGMIISVFLAAWRSFRRLRPLDPDSATQVRTLAVGLIAFLQAGIFGTLHHVAPLYVYLGVLLSFLLIQNGNGLPVAIHRMKPSGHLLPHRRRLVPVLRH